MTYYLVRLRINRGETVVPVFAASPAAARIAALLTGLIYQATVGR